MKKIFTPNKKFSKGLYIALLFIAGVLTMLLITGTIFGLIRSGKSKPVFVINDSSHTQERLKIDDIRVYSGLERLRIPLSNSSILILSAAFPYSANDIAFTEELAAKINDFKIIITGYFSSLPAEKIIQIDEEAAKQEILRRFNANLRLGRISALYFNDLMVIDSAGN
jgi:flagellar basal body-associated protein FliL